MKALKRIIKHRARISRRKLDIIQKNKVKINRVESKKNIIIYLFEAAHYQALHLIHFGILLEARGHNVHFVFCTNENALCEIKNYKTNSKITCSNCKYTRKLFKKNFGIKIIEIPDLIDPIERQNYTNFEFTGSIDATATRYYMGDTKKAMIDVNLKEKLKKIAQNLWKFCHQLDAEYAPDLVISNMSDYVYFSPMFEYFKASDRFMQISSSSFEFDKVYIDRFQLFPATHSFKEYLFEKKELSKHEEKKVHDFMLERFGNTQPSLDKYEYQNIQLESIKRQLNFNPQKRNIFLFPNLHWDIGQASKNLLFTDVVEWVGQTFNIMSQQDNIQLYIKPHPAEDFNKHKGDQGIIGAVKAKGYEIPKNVFIIDNKWRINPYDMFPLMDLAVISSGTLGLESLYKEIECINVGVAAYANTDLDRCPSNIAEYKNLLIDGDSRARPPRSLVMSFLYFYFIHRQTKWPLSSKFGHDERFSVLELETHNMPQINSILENIEERLNVRQA